MRNHFSVEGFPIVTAQEMARVEGLAYKGGASEQTFMERAGIGVAEKAIAFLTRHHLPKLVTLLVGKGNNGGDAYAAGFHLLEKGIKTTAWHLYGVEQCSPLCQIMHERFRLKGGIVHHGHSKPFLEQEGILLDGLVGTGFQGKAEGELAFAIELANSSGLPILAIDIPSGLNGTTGEVASVAIHATETLFLELPKLGFFLGSGWNHVGELKRVPFGLEEKYTAQANASAGLFNEAEVAHFLPPIKRTRHKYQAGYVLAVAGSSGMSGAAVMASFSALRAGAGIVRLFHPEKMEAELGSAPYELIREGWDGKELKRMQTEAERAKVMLIGPGMGRTADAKKRFSKLIKEIPLPLVLDADALYFLSEMSSWELPEGSILTPHYKEMERLVPHFGKKDDNRARICQEFVEEKRVTLILKGAPTFIFHPQHLPLVVTRGNPGMATAGSGDVLTGIVAAMIAQGLNTRTAAALAAHLHGSAGESAAEALTPYCMTATDLLDFLPAAFKSCSRKEIGYCKNNKI